MHTTDRSMAEAIAGKVAAMGGAVYYVGGYVRDTIRGVPSKDVDIEVHGIGADLLEEILAGLGSYMEMGKSFGIYSLKGCNLDIALPRKEKNDNRMDCLIDTMEAARRRDFTINSMMQNVLTGELEDHFGGMQDLRNGIIRHVHPDTFIQDPLRVLRAAQFASRFGFSVAPETVALCSTVDLSGLARERIFGELSKALLNSSRPSVFFSVLRQMNQLHTWFPEAEQLVGVEQNPRYHAEGDVWNHTMLVLDAAADLRDRAGNPLGLMLAALTHDFGKAVCTESVDGVIHAYGHEKLGLPLCDTFLNRLTTDRRLREYVMNLSELHMKPNVEAAQNSSVKSTNRLFDRAIDPEGLICMALADSRGRISESGREDNEAFLRSRLSIYREYMARPFVTGRDLLDAGLSPSADFSVCLEFAHKLRLAGISREEALRQTIAMAGKRERTAAAKLHGNH